MVFWSSLSSRCFHGLGSTAVTIFGKRSETYTILFLAIWALAGIGYLAQKIFLSANSDGFDLDFRMVWLAGKIWASGGDPYGPAFAKEYLEEFRESGINMYWVYPPYWYTLALPFGVLPFGVSRFLWNALNLLLLIASCHLV
jgi:hypothetical protein